MPNVCRSGAPRKPRPLRLDRRPWRAASLASWRKRGPRVVAVGGSISDRSEEMTRWLGVSRRGACMVFIAVAVAVAVSVRGRSRRDVVVKVTRWLEVQNVNVCSSRGRYGGCDVGSPTRGNHQLGLSQLPRWHRPLSTVSVVRRHRCVICACWLTEIHGRHCRLHAVHRESGVLLAPNTGGVPSRPGLVPCRLRSLIVPGCITGWVSTYRYDRYIIHIRLFSIVGWMQVRMRVHGREGGMHLESRQRQHRADGWR